MIKADYTDLNGVTIPAANRDVTEHKRDYDDFIDYDLDFDPMGGFEILEAYWKDTGDELTPKQYEDLAEIFKQSMSYEYYHGLEF